MSSFYQNNSSEQSGLRQFGRDSFVESLPRVKAQAYSQQQQEIYMDYIKVTVILEVPSIQKPQSVRPPLRQVVVKIGPEFQEFWI